MEERHSLRGHKKYGISKSALDLIAHSPAHYCQRYILMQKTEPTAAMIAGRYVHAAFLEPEKRATEYTPEPDLHRNTNAYKEWRAKVPSGITPIPKGVCDNTESLVAEAMRHEIIGRYLAGAIRKEHEIQWTDDATGVLCQARIDLICGGSGHFVCDIKVASDAGESSMVRAIEDRRLDVQGAFYIDGARANGFLAERYFILAMELEQPHLMAVYEIDQESLDAARAAYRHDLWLWRACVEADKWPGFESRIKVVGTRPWIKKQRMSYREVL